jgi:FlaA1/EpsC-like NDP-sugar epimerase
MDLARDLVRLAGRDPESQPIEIVGLRSGEKLHEELFYGDETVDRTPSAKVLRVSAEPPPESIRQDVFDMIAIASGDHEEALRSAVVRYAQDRRDVAGEAVTVIDAAVAGADPVASDDEVPVPLA